MKVSTSKFGGVSLLLATTATILFAVKTHYEASHSMDSYMHNLRNSHNPPNNILAAEADDVAVTADNDADSSHEADWIVFRTLPKKSIMTPAKQSYDLGIDYSLIESRLDQALYGSKEWNAWYGLQEWELTHHKDTEDGRPLPHFFMHIPKTGGYYAYTWLNRMLFQKGSPIFQLPIEDKYRLCNIGTERLKKRKESHKGKNDKAPVRCNMWMTERGYNEDAANTYTVIRNPREHVLSQYFHCTESKHSKDYRLRRIGSLDDWLKKWTDTLEGEAYIVDEKEKEAKNMACYDPRNKQSQFTNYGDGPSNDWPGKHFRWSSLNDALRDIQDRFTVIGPMDEMDRVLCVTFLHYTGWLPPQCDCTTKTTTTTTDAKMQSKHETKESHGVKHHATSYITTSYQDMLIDKLTEKDVMLYEGVKHLFNEQVKLLESRLNVKICNEFRL